MTTEIVIEAFDQFAAHKDPEAFAVVILGNARMYRSSANLLIGWHIAFILSICRLVAGADRNLWREIKYRWLPLTAYSSFDKLCEAVKTYAMVTAPITQ